MAKGQQRAPKEKKKPKQDKSKSGGQSAYKQEFGKKPGGGTAPGKA
jgi:hypothetical protein